MNALLSCGIFEGSYFFSYCSINPFTLRIKTMIIVRMIFFQSSAEDVVVAYDSLLLKMCLASSKGGFKAQVQNVDLITRGHVHREQFLKGKANTIMVRRKEWEETLFSILLPIRGTECGWCPHTIAHPPSDGASVRTGCLFTRKAYLSQESSSDLLGTYWCKHSAFFLKESKESVRRVWQGIQGHNCHFISS